MPTTRNVVRGLVAALLLASAGIPAARAQTPKLQTPDLRAPESEAPGPKAPQPTVPRGGTEPGMPQAQPEARPPETPAPPQAQGPEEGPPTPDERAKLLETLYGRLAASPSPEDSEPIARTIERLWHYSGSATADLLVERAIAAVQTDDRDLAMKFLDAAVLLQPDFAEAWNRRAYLYYLKNDYTRALGDLRRVLALEPNHFKALEGLAQILRSIGEKKAALETYRKLLAVHPQAAGARQAVDELTVEVEGQGI